MKMATVSYRGQEQAAFVHNDSYYLIDSINDMENKNWPNDVFHLIEGQYIEELEIWYLAGGKELLDYCHPINNDQTDIHPLYDKPGKIIGITVPHHFDTSKRLPTCFIKPSTSIIGDSDAIQAPFASRHISAKAELAIIIGKTGRNIEMNEAENYIAGYTTAIDITETTLSNQDVITAKSFDTFFSLGSEFISKNSAERIEEWSLSTLHNGILVHEIPITDLPYSLSSIVSHHSKSMTLLPGDILLVGNPEEVAIQRNDQIAALVDGFTPLINCVT
nr:fumarylacetoacetate hydrolase family protein [Gracilibacillus timonensis]